MTYSIAAKCRETGMYGVAATTSSQGIGARCLYARADTGAVLTQNLTDPRLGSSGIEMFHREKPPRRLSTGWFQGTRISATANSLWWIGMAVRLIFTATRSPQSMGIMKATGALP